MRTAFSFLSLNKAIPIFTALLLLPTTSAAKSDMIKLASPYQSIERSEQQISDKSESILRCIFNLMQLEYSVTQTPTLRAEKQLSSNKVFGVVTTIPFKEIEENTVLSAPLVLEKWSWYFKATDLLSPTIDQHLLNVGAINSSNQAIWLQSQGYKNLTLVDSYEQLLKLLEKQRIDVFIADQVPLQNALKKTTDIKVKSKFLNYIPKGVYFSRAYVKDHPNFMGRFNHSVYSCTPEVIELLAKEKLLIKKRVLPMIDNWIQAPIIKQVLQAQNKRNINTSQTQIITMDKAWVKEVESGNFAMVQAMLDSPLSSFLKDKQTQSKGLYTELFITDIYGLNAAMSQPTSDYWQGDELKYQQTLGRPNGSIYIDDVHYDESTKRFQAQISLVISDENTNKALGMLTVGVNVEKALSLEQ